MIEGESRKSKRLGNRNWIWLEWAKQTGKLGPERIYKQVQFGPCVKRVARGGGGTFRGGEGEPGSGGEGGGEMDGKGFVLLQLHILATAAHQGNRSN